MPNYLPYIGNDPTFFKRAIGGQQVTNIQSPYDELYSRISGAKRNLGISTLMGLASNFLQSRKSVTPKFDSRFLDETIQSTPQYIKDYENSQIDRNTRSVVGQILATNPLNRSAGTIAAVTGSAAEAKAGLAVRQGRDDIGLKNSFLLKKQQRLDAENQEIAAGQNQEIQAGNNQISNTGALATNYYNELQKATSNEQAIYDRKDYIKSMGVNNQALMMSLAKGGMFGGGEPGVPKTTDNGVDPETGMPVGANPTRGLVFDEITGTWASEQEMLKRYAWRMSGRKMYPPTTTKE